MYTLLLSLEVDPETTYSEDSISQGEMFGWYTGQVTSNLKRYNQTLGSVHEAEGDIQQRRLNLKNRTKLRKFHFLLFG